MRLWLALPVSWALLLGCATTQSAVHGGFVGLDDGGKVVLATHDGGTVRLFGPDAEELEAIVGANVKVEGLPAPGGFTVRRYQIIDVGNGFFAYVGWVSVDQSGCWFREWRTGRDWQLELVDTEEFKRLHHVKIWISGVEVGPRRLQPLQWGVLRAREDEQGN